MKASTTFHAAVVALMGIALLYQAARANRFRSEWHELDQHHSAHHPLCTINGQIVSSTLPGPTPMTITTSVPFGTEKQAEADACLMHTRVVKYAKAEAGL